MKYAASLAFLFVGLGIVACKKDSTTSTPTPSTSTRTTALINKRWGLTALTSQQAGSSVINDNYATLRTCEKDNYLRFNADNTAEANEGPTKCASSDAQSQPGTWALTANDSKLLLTTPLFGSGGAAVLDITELTDTRMVLQSTLVSNAGSSNGVITTYKATLLPY